METAKKLITETIERRGPPEEDEPVAPTETPKPTKVEKKEQTAPDIEAKEVFPSLGAALTGGGSKRAMKSAKMQLKQKAEAVVNGKEVRLLVALTAACTPM